MLAVEAGKRILPCWKRWGTNEEPEVCSFEDTLDAYPARIKEGQNRKALQEDLETLEGRTKTTKEQGELVHLVISNRSAYALRMTNTVGRIFCAENRKPESCGLDPFKNQRLRHSVDGNSTKHSSFCC